VQLAGLVCLGPEITCSGATTYEVSRKDGLDDGAEDSLGATGLGKGHPQNNDELEQIVEWEPVGGTDGALDNR